MHIFYLNAFLLITESTRFTLSQPDHSVKVKGQTAQLHRGKQMNKKTGAGRETVPSLTSQGGKKQYKNVFICISRRDKYIRKHIYELLHVHI